LRNQITIQKRKNQNGTTIIIVVPFWYQVTEFRGNLLSQPLVQLGKGKIIFCITKIHLALAETERKNTLIDMLPLRILTITHTG
ncbi:MAG: hypothetical protein ACRCZY_10945, partial [Phocaeicola sp.]